MQNRYVGDIGDFGKYGLLKALCLSSKTDNGPTLSLGVVWYLVHGKPNSGDGGFIQYLYLTSPERDDYRECDPKLYDSLKEIVQPRSRDTRDIRKIRKQGVLPSNTIFYEEFLTFCGIPPYQKSSQKKRMAHRERWVKGALDATADCNLIFLDPDTGMETPSLKPHLGRAIKYAFFDELSQFFDRGQSLVVYQHINHIEKAEKQIHRRLQEIKERLNPRAEPFALLFHRFSARAFFIIPSEHHQTLLRERTKHFLSGRWSRHFERIPPSASLTH